MVLLYILYENLDYLIWKRNTMSELKKIVWVDNETPLNAENLNVMTDKIWDNSSAIEELNSTKQDTIKGETGKIAYFDVNGKIVSSEINEDSIVTKQNIDQNYNPESENAQSGIAVAEALQGAKLQWKKLTDVTITEEVNTITFTHEDIPRCKEFIVRAIFPVSTTGGTVSLGTAYCYLNNNIVAFRFTTTNINQSAVTEQRCHILIADNLIYSTGTEGASGQAAVIENVKTLIGNRVITHNVTQIIYKLYDSTKSYQIGTQFQVYGKVEK